MKMLKLFKRDGTPVQSFVNYSDLFLHLVHEEKAGLFENHPRFVRSRWHFEYLSPRMVAERLNMLGRRHDEAVLLDAWRQGLPVLDRCEGDCERAWQTPITPNMSVEAMREDWCEDYCEIHGYVLSRPPSSSGFREFSQQRAGGDSDCTA